MAGEPRSERYIGDGVYASFDGWHVWLHTPRVDGVLHAIALEPSVFKELRKFCEEVWEKS
jgi:hypothetical protein